MATTPLSVRAALQVVLDCVDYTKGNCGPAEPVAGALPRIVIQNAREALENDAKEVRVSDLRDENDDKHDEQHVQA